MLNPEQIEFACTCFIKWINTCEKNNRGYSIVDVDHSVLLRRLLAGESFHEQPPPKRFSYPAWEMVEKEEIEIVELRIEEDRVIIDQSDEYELEENNIIRHKRLGIRWEYFEKEVIPDIKRLRKGLIPEDHKYIGKFLRKINVNTIS